MSHPMEIQNKELFSLHTSYAEQQSFWLGLHNLWPISPIQAMYSMAAYKDLVTNFLLLLSVWSLAGQFTVSYWVCRPASGYKNQ